MLARSRLRQGFTLIELMTAVAIVAVLATLAVTLMVYGTGRARMNNTTFDLAAMMSAAQMSAMNRGQPHYLIVYQTPAGSIQSVLVERPDSPELTPAQWAALDLSHVPGAQEGPHNSPSLVYQRIGAGGVPETVPALELDRLRLGVSSGPDSGGVSFLDLDAPRVRRPLPPPFNNIPLESPSTPGGGNQATSNLLAGCSFCIESGGVAYGVIRFNTNGTVEIVTGPSPAGGAIAFMPSTQEERNFAYRLLIIAAPAGIVHTYQETF